MHISPAPTPRRPHPCRAAPRTIEQLEPRRLLAGNAPTADAVANLQGFYEIQEGQEVLLDASQSSDPDNDIVSYTWTINGQVQTPKQVPTLLLTWGELEDMNLGDGTATYDVSVTVRDLTHPVTPESTASTTLTINNAPPRARFDVERVNDSLSWAEGRDILVTSFVDSDFNSTLGSLYDYHTEISLDGVVVATDDVTTTDFGTTFQYTLPDPGLLEVRVTVTDHDPSGPASAPATLDVFGDEEVFSMNILNIPVSVQSFQANVAGAAEGTGFGVGIAAQAASNDVLTYEWWLEREIAPTQFVAEPSFFGPDVVNLTPRNDGMYRIKVTIRDGDSGGTLTTGTFGVANLAPIPTISGVPTADVYVSTTVTLVANDNDPGVDDTHTYYWTVNGTPLAPSSSPTLDIDVTSAGTYNFSLVVVDDGGLQSDLVTGSFQALAQETATLAYTGQLHFTTSSATDTTADVMLRIAITDPDGGDVTRATVTFFNTQTLEVYSSGVPVTALTGTSTGFAATSFIHTLASDPEFLHIGVRIDGGGPYADALVEAIATISPPGDGKVIASGSMIGSSSAGLFGAAPGTSMLFAANARSTGAGIKGGLEVTFRSFNLPDGTTGSELRTYLISSTAVTSLGTTAGDNADTASIIATVDVYDITDRKKTDYELVHTGLALEMTLTDGGNKGEGDGIAFSMWNSSGGLMFASSWDGTRATEDVLETGDIKINGI